MWTLNANKPGWGRRRETRDLTEGFKTPFAGNAKNCLPEDHANQNIIRVVQNNRKPQPNCHTKLPLEVSHDSDNLKILRS